MAPVVQINTVQFYNYYLFYLVFLCFQLVAKSHLQLVTKQQSFIQCCGLVKFSFGPTYTRMNCSYNWILRIFLYWKIDVSAFLTTKIHEIQQTTDFYTFVKGLYNYMAFVAITLPIVRAIDSFIGEGTTISNCIIFIYIDIKTQF